MLSTDDLEVRAQLVKDLDAKEFLIRMRTVQRRHADEPSAGFGQDIRRHRVDVHDVNIVFHEDAFVQPQEAKQL